MQKRRFSYLPVAAAIVAVFPTATAQALPPGFTLERSGSIHDFDYFRGGWNTAQHRLSDARNPDRSGRFPGTCA